MGHNNVEIEQNLNKCHELLKIDRFLPSIPENEDKDSKHKKE